MPQLNQHVAEVGFGKIRENCLKFLVGTLEVGDLVVALEIPKQRTSTIRNPTQRL
jgi:hypothetical protein